ncbi:MAG: hypothetical protein KF883_04100 [Thermomicrobiales bacterium]|jgi:hypothetical protein|nr:hypothetical protein [Thermomicrobiales bacterium]MCC6945899.1 hypothetical protein [Thermomicrobiales bacterium]
MMESQMHATRTMGELIPAHVLEEQRVTLERRLHEGYVRIEEALVAGQDVAGWERFWIELLHQYEAVCAQLEAA